MSRHLGRHLACALLATAVGGPSCSRQEPTPAPAPVLTVLMGADVASLDPHASFDDVSSVLLGNLFESLVRFEGNLQLAPGLAQRWINPDDHTWRFFLDTKARFPDGSPLRASDVKFSIERLQTQAGSQLSGFVRHVVAVEVVDEATVDVRTDRPVAILNGLAFIPVVSEKHVRAAGQRAGEQPFGTGPYKLARWDKGRSIVLEANEHHQPPAPVRRVEVLLRDGGDLLQEVLTLRPQLTLFLRLSQVAEIERTKPAGLHVLTVDGLSVFFVTFNLSPRVPAAFPRGPNPLREARLRKALAHAVDREEMVRSTPLGLRRASQLVVPPVFGYDASLVPPPHDPAAARAVVAAAGLAGLELPIDVRKGGTYTLEKLLVRQWERIGVKARLHELSGEDYTRALEARAFAATVQGYTCTSGDAGELFTFLLRTPDRSGGFGAGNYAGYSNPEVDRIVDENLSEFDARARLALLRRGLRLASEDLPYLPLVVLQDTYVASTGIRWTPRVSGEVHFDEIRFEEGRR